jgi:hypothetical protein
VETKFSGEIKELAAGGYSSVKDSFVIVARDSETYAQVKELNEGLPDFGADFFKSNAVITVFLGQRRSGGYSVSITREGTGTNGALRIAEKSPPKDAMVTMALTAPFQIVSVAVAEESPLALELDATWQAAARPYKVETGEFTRSGGTVSSHVKLSLKGDIRIMRHAQLATLFFALQGTGADGAHTLRDTVTGIVTPEGNLTITRLAPGSFLPRSSRALRGQGKFNDNENLLALEVLGAKVKDAEGGQGNLKAVAMAPPPKKRSLAGDDEM